MSDPVTGTVEKDGVVTIGEGDAAVRYVKETDLLAVKGSKESAVASATSDAKAAAEAVAATTLDTEKNKVLQAEAKVTGLEEQITKGGVSEEELTRLKGELETAKTSGESLGTKFLGLKREVIVKAYGVPKETVESKDLAALDGYEEALKAVIGDKNLGNFAIAGGTGGASALQGKNPMELAVQAYSTSNAK